MSCPETSPVAQPTKPPWYRLRLRTLLILAAVSVPVVVLRVVVVPAILSDPSYIDDIELPSQIRVPDNAKLPPEFQRLVGLHKPLGEPEPGDWLACHMESGQSYEEYLQFQPVRPTAERRVLYVQPLGDLSPTQRRIVHLTAEYLGLFYQLPVQIRDDLPLSLIPADARRTGSSYGDLQILTTYVLEDVLKPRLPADAVALTAFTACDLWPGRGWNCVYGQASLVDRVGVWSMIRFGEPDRGPADFLRVLRRTLAVASHETGHMFSIQHCVFSLCVMCGANHMAELDSHPMWLCPQCLAKLCHATGANPEKRFAALIGFAKQHDLKPEADFWQRSLDALRKPPGRP